MSPGKSCSRQATFNIHYGDQSDLLGLDDWIQIGKNDYLHCWRVMVSVWHEKLNK